MPVNNWMINFSKVIKQKRKKATQMSVLLLTENRIGFMSKRNVFYFVYILFFVYFLFYFWFNLALFFVLQILKFPNMPATSISCYVCNATDSSSPFQCGEWFERYDTPDIVPQDCSNVYGAKYCVKHIGRFEGKCAWLNRIRTDSIILQLELTGNFPGTVQ